MTKTGKNLSTTERNKVVQFLLQNLKNGKPNRRAVPEAMTKWSGSSSTIYRLWRTANKQQNEGEVILLQSGKITATRNKRIIIDLELIKSIELHKRATIRKLASGIQLASGSSCSKSTVGRWVKNGLIKAHSSAIRPDLTAPNKLLRLRFSMEALEFDRVLNNLKFKSMHNVVHIDEKWFYLTKAAHRFYLTPAEADPHRSCKNKSFITNVMFMCAVCRPIFSEDGSVIFDGKIGIFPFTEKIAAKRKSKNRAAGTMETKAIQSTTREVTKTCFINQMLPAIRAKWPANASKIVFIQQDNAKPHIKDIDPQFREATMLDGFDIRLTNQPPNPLDTNVLDLGFFRAIQSIQIETACYNVDQLVNAICLAYEQLSPMTLNKVFLSLQGCMIEIMKCKGQNCYRIPHLKKDSLIRQEMLPKDLEVAQSLVEECIEYMTENEMVTDIVELWNRLDLNVEDWT